MEQQIEDPIVLKVMAKYHERSQTGIKKYGTMLTRDDLKLTDWLTHLQEELMDATLYAEVIRKEVKHSRRKAFKLIDDYIEWYFTAMKERGSINPEEMHAKVSELKDKF